MTRTPLLDSRGTLLIISYNIYKLKFVANNTFSLHLQLLGSKSMLLNLFFRPRFLLKCSSFNPIVCTYKNTTTILGTTKKRLNPSGPKGDKSTNVRGLQAWVEWIPWWVCSDS